MSKKECISLLSMVKSLYTHQKQQLTISLIIYKNYQLQTFIIVYRS